MLDNLYLSQLENRGTIQRRRWRRAGTRSWTSGLLTQSTDLCAETCHGIFLPCLP